MNFTSRDFWGTIGIAKSHMHNALEAQLNVYKVFQDNSSQSQTNAYFSGAMTAAN